MTELLPHIWIGFSSLLLPALVVVIVVGALSAVLLRLMLPTPSREGATLVVGLSFCGYIIGAIAGNSESAMSQAIITGFIGILSGLVAYVHVKETTKASGLRTQASVALVAMLIALLMGLIVGGAYKRRFESYRVAIENYKIYYKEFAIPLCLAERKHVLEGNAEPSISSACQSVELGLKPR